MYLATLVCPTSMPSLSSSRWIRGAPPERVGNAHVTDQLTYLKRHGRPSAARPRLPAPVRSESMRCQRITVSGLIIASAARTSGNSRQRPTKITRSVLLKAGLFGPVRRRTLICWRSTRFSTSSANLERNRPTSAHQISLQTSLIADSINRFALARYWVRFAVGTGADHCAEGCEPVNHREARWTLARTQSTIATTRPTLVRNLDTPASIMIRTPSAYATCSSAHRIRPTNRQITE